MILSPMKNEAYDDRESDCQMALELEVHEVVDRASAAGWSRSEAMAAIAHIALNQMFAEQENEMTNSWVAKALGRVEH